jgi:hypothetical protein
MVKVNPDNYFVVQGWMISELGLKGNALLLYAIIYGFSQTTNTGFTGSVDYLCGWLGGVSRPTVINTLDNLVQQGLLTKSSVTKGALTYNTYTAIHTSKEILPDEESTSKKILPVTSKKILLNNNSIDNKEKSLPKGKEGGALKKSYNEVFSAPENEVIKDALVKFVSVCKGRNYSPKVETVERFAQTLRETAKDDKELAMAMVQQSIDKGWKDIYPLKKGYKPEAVSVPVSKEDKAKNPDGSYVVF